MKTTIKTLLIIFALYAAPSFAAAPKPQELVHVLSTKRYVFHFKVDKQMIGGTVSIFDGNHALIMNEAITQSKNIIDFFELAAGYYTIRIQKGDKEVNFEYTNFE